MVYAPMGLGSIVCTWAAFSSVLLVSVTGASSLPADLNGDGVVDHRDVEIVQGSLGAKDPNIIPIDGAAGGSFVLDQTGKTYVLQGPTTGHFIVQADNLVLDLNRNEVNGLPAGVASVTVQGRDRITLRNGTIHGSPVGITIRDSNDLHLEDLTVQDCLNEGIVVSSSNRISLNRVACKGNYHGIVFSGVRDILATNCDVSENRDIGIRCTGCNNASFNGITARANATDGMDFAECHSVHVRGLQAVQNKDDGIDFRDTTCASLSESVSDNDGPSLELDGGSDVTVRDSRYGDGADSEHLVGFNVVRRFSSLRVRVVDNNEAPLVGARVEIHDTSQAPAGMTGQADLAFSLKTDYQGNLPALDLLWYTRMGTLVTQSGPYRLRVTCPGFQVAEWSYDAHAPAEKTFMLRP